MDKIYYFSLTKTNKDCFINIKKFIYPSKKQIMQCKYIHSRKAICKHRLHLNYCYHNKGIYLYKCFCKSNYISVIKNAGNYYNYFKSYTYFKILLENNLHYKSFFHYILFQKYI